MKFSYDIVSTKSINPATSLEISIYISNQNKISKKHTTTSFNSLWISAYHFWRRLNFLCRERFDFLVSIHFPHCAEGGTEPGTDDTDDKDGVVESEWSGVENVVSADVLGPKGVQGVTEREEWGVVHLNGELGPHGGLAVEESGGVESSSTVTLMSLKLFVNLFFFGGGWCLDWISLMIWKVSVVCKTCWTFCSIILVYVFPSKTH